MQRSEDFFVGGEGRGGAVNAEANNGFLPQS